MLVGLVTCLGAGARFSNRGSKVGDLVKNGCNQAIVRITLRNEGPEAYKPEVYGVSITVERRINREGGGAYAIKDSSGRKQSSTREELDAILEQFNIQVDNPCNVLMQDASKLFLAGNKPEKKYELFLKATQLEQLKEDLEQTGNNLKMSEASLESKQEALVDMEEKMKRLEAKVQALQALETHRNKVKEMRAMLAWSHVQVKEAELEQVEAEMAQADERTSKLTEARRQREASIAAMQRDQAQQSQALERFRADAERVAQESHRLALEERRIRAESTKFDAEIESRREEQQRVQKRRDAVKHKIRTLQSQGRGDDKEAEYRRNLASAAKKKEQVERLSADLKAHEARRPLLEADVSADEERIAGAEAKLASAKKELEKVDSEIKRLGQVGKDRTAAFGVSAVLVRQLINANRKEFRKHPIGPIGMHVTLTDDTWAIAVDLIAGKTFDKFIVDSIQDLQAFQLLMKRNNVAEHPQIIVTPFDQPKYQLPAGRLPDASRYTTILDALQIDNPTCFNALVDDCSIEAVALFKTLAEAKHEMFGSGKNGPQNVKEGYSLENHVQLAMSNGTQSMKGLRPRRMTRLQPDVAGALEGYKARSKDLASQIGPMAQDLQKIQSRFNTNSRELRDLVARTPKIPGDVERLSAEIEELERPPEVAPDKRDEINSLESTLPDFDVKITAAQEEIARIEGAKKTFLEQLRPVHEQLEALKTETASIDANLSAAVVEVDSITKAMTTMQSKMPVFEEALQKLSNQLVALNEKHATQSKIVEEYCVKAQVFAKRPSKPIEGDPEHLANKITSMEQMIVEQQREQSLDSNVVEQYEEAKAAITALKEGIDETKATIDMATDMLKRRATRWVDFRKRIQQRTKALFISYLSQRNFLGDLEFDHKQKTLNIKINPNRADADGEVRDTSTLSGGERSYSTVSLLLALWEMMESPFRAMDEFDVFMDAVNRLVAMEMLLNAASQKKHRQHIFLTPQQLQGVQAQDWIKIFRMKPPERNQRTITSMMNGGAEGEE